MSNFERLLSDLGKKGEKVIIAVGGTFTEAKELVNTRKQLENTLHNLGVSIYEEYCNKPNSAVFKRFAEDFKAIETLSEHEDNLEELIAKKFGKRICPECEALISADNKFCPHCGEEFVEETKETDLAPAENVCHHCGMQHDETDVFCGHCGNKLGQSEYKSCCECGKENRPEAKFCRHCGKEF